MAGLPGSALLALACHSATDEKITLRYGEDGLPISDAFVIGIAGKRRGAQTQSRVHNFSQGAQPAER